MMMHHPPPCSTYTPFYLIVTPFVVLTFALIDGFDVSGRNVHMHDLKIWNQDDCIAVKDSSENMLFERITASGLGLAVGSIGKSLVRNITFRDCVLTSTVKGIYVKTRWDEGLPSTGHPIIRPAIA